MKKQLANYNEIFSKLGVRIRQFRKEKALSQDTLATQVGVSREYFSRIERGKCNFSILHFINMCLVLCVSPSDLLIADFSSQVKPNMFPARFAETVDDVMIIVGERMRILRKKRGYSQQEHFANAADLSRAYYSAIERGEHNFTIQHLFNICAIFDVEPSCLFPSLLALAKNQTKKRTNS